MFGKEQTLDLRVRGKNSSNENSWWQQHPDDERSHLNEECGLFGVWVQIGRESCRERV